VWSAGNDSGVDSLVPSGGRELLEREIFDLFGFVLQGTRPRGFTSEIWEGHHLRKNYPWKLSRRPNMGELFRESRRH